MPQIKVENLYDTTITEPGGIPSSGDCNFTVATPPQNTNGFIIISPENILLREIMYYHDVIGNRIYVRGENRPTPKAHTVTESVKMNDVAEIFNTFSDMISQMFYVEKTGGLTVKVWGGYVYYNGNMVTVPDTNLTLTDNATNYIKYDYASNTISVNTTNNGNIKVVVTTIAGLINNISYRNPKESYIDFSVSLTGALPSQSGNAGKVLFTNGTTVYWGNIVIPNASTTVAGSVEQATDTEASSGMATGGTGAPLFMNPDQIQTLGRFGDGSDGDVVISVNTTLTRDMYYNNLTVNTGILLNPGGYAIHVKGTLTLSGTAKIIRNGNNGSNASGVTGGAGGAALNNGTCGVNLGGANGANGAISVGATGSGGLSVNPSYASTGTTGATGGRGANTNSTGVSGGNGGSGGTATRGDLYNVVSNLWKIISYFMVPSRGIVPYNGLPSSGGGGAGGGEAGTSGQGGGGAGGNGGNIFIFATTLAGTGTIESIGGNGGQGGVSASTNSGCGGGGAGGNGGIVFIVYRTGTVWTRTLTGGTGGAIGGGTSTALATAGSAGTVGQSIIVQV